MASAVKDRVMKNQSSRRGTASSSGDSVAPSSHGSRSPRSNEAVSQLNRGFDGNADPTSRPDRDPAHSNVLVDPKSKNFDLGMAGWSTARGIEVAATLPRKPPLSKLGTPTTVGLNSYQVESFPSIPVYQYDVSIGNGVEKRGVIMKVWQSKAVQQVVGPFCIFDGNKLAWSGKPITRELRILVDLDAEHGRQPGKKGPDTHYIQIRQTNTVRFETLLAHLKGTCRFDNAVLEAITFADHLLRETPSKNYTPIKRAYFRRGDTRFDLGGGVEAVKGVYQSLRLVHPGSLSVNIDVANGTMWSANPLHLTANLVCETRDLSDLSVKLGSSFGGEKGRAGTALKKLRKVRVIAKHRGKPDADEYCIDRFIFKSARKHMVTFKPTPDGKEMSASLYDYFAKKYGIRLNYPDLPLCKMTKGANTVLPMEVLTIKGNQRNLFKLDERQTANMIKFAVTPPAQRLGAIEDGVKMLDWAKDPVLAKYGLKINPNKTTVAARLLPAPVVKFGTGEAKPGTSGRWDLKNKKFLTVNPVALKSWSVTVYAGKRGGKPDKNTLERFVQAFVQGYISHGGRVENKQPIMQLADDDDVSKWVTNAWNMAGNQAQCRPQMLVFVLPDKDSKVYGRIKRNCECRYGIVSQCVQYSQVMKCQAQYISNVCMKFNAKLGGATCRAVGPKTGGPTGPFAISTMIIGADVSHPAPGAQLPSMAAMTVSQDKLGIRYAALVQTNGYRVEMVNTDIIMNELKTYVQNWMTNVNSGKVPAQIIYLRDGVSEGQYQHVLQQEVVDMKRLLKGADPSGSTKFVVVVGSKRHHVRFFPKGGDRNGNPLPGTLVETGVTNPFENDFYLCSHSAIKGTARPAHYYVLLNESNMSNDTLHTILYEQAYQYQRATTPISQHPAIYYAHLAALRAAPHDPKWGGTSDPPPDFKQKQSGAPAAPQPEKVVPAGKTGKDGKDGSSVGGHPADYDRLMPMPNQGGLVTSMWYI